MSINFTCSINLNPCHNKEKLNLVGIQEKETKILFHRGAWRRRACFRIASSICSFLQHSVSEPCNGMNNSTSESGQAAELQHVERERYVSLVM